MTGFNLKQAAQSIKSYDVQGATTALKAALQESATDIGTAQITPKYNSAEDTLTSGYTLEVTQAGLYLDVILAGVMTADGQTLVGGDFVILDYSKQNVVYLGFEFLTGLAAKYQGQTLTAVVAGAVADSSGNQQGSFSAQADVTIS